MLKLGDEKLSIYVLFRAVTVIIAIIIKVILVANLK